MIKNFFLYNIILATNDFKYCKITLQSDLYTYNEYKEIISIRILHFLFEAYTSSNYCVYDKYFEKICVNKEYNMPITQTKEFLMQYLNSKIQIDQNKYSHNCFNDLITSIEYTTDENICENTKNYILQFFNENTDIKNQIHSKFIHCKTIFYIFVYEYIKQLRVDNLFFKNIIYICNNFICDNYIFTNEIFLNKNMSFNLSQVFRKYRKKNNVRELYIFNINFLDFFVCFFIKIIKELRTENLFNGHDIDAKQKNTIYQTKIIAEIDDLFGKNLWNINFKKSNALQELVIELIDIKFVNNPQIYCNCYLENNLRDTIEFCLRMFFSNNQHYVEFFTICFVDGFHYFHIRIMHFIYKIALEKKYSLNQNIRIYKYN